MKSNLANKKGKPADQETKPLKGEALRQSKNQLAGNWRLVNGRRLEKEFKFRDFRQALQFTNKAGRVAEKQGHHPDIFLTYGKVRLQICTHKINGLTKDDFILAAGINKLE